jgi:hypothetical protein
VKGGEGGVEPPVEGAVRREDRSRPWEEPDPPTPRTPTSPAPPYFLDVVPPPSSSSSPASRTTSLHRRLHFGPWPPR